MMEASNEFRLLPKEKVYIAVMHWKDSIIVLYCVLQIKKKCA